MDVTARFMPVMSREYQLIVANVAVSTIPNCVPREQNKTRPSFQFAEYPFVSSWKILAPAHAEAVMAIVQNLGMGLT